MRSVVDTLTDLQKQVMALKCVAGLSGASNVEVAPEGQSAGTGYGEDAPGRRPRLAAVPPQLEQLTVNGSGPEATRADGAVRDAGTTRFREDDPIALLESLAPAPVPETALVKARGRARVMAAARERLESRSVPALVMQPAGLATAAVSALLALGSGGTIVASAHAPAGEPLHMGKLAVEEAQGAVVAVTGDPLTAAVVLDERASNRVAEIEALISLNKPASLALAATASQIVAAASVAARVPESRLPELAQRRGDSQSRRTETLHRILARVPAPAQPAIASAIERGSRQVMPDAPATQDAQDAQDPQEEPEASGLHGAQTPNPAQLLGSVSVPPGQRLPDLPATRPTEPNSADSGRDGGPNGNARVDPAGADRGRQR